MRSLVQHLIRDSALKYPNKPGLKQKEKVYTYIKIERLTTKISNAISDAGTARGQGIGGLLDHSPDQILFILSLYFR